MYNLYTVRRLEVLNQRWIIILVFYKGANCTLIHHVANISRSIELEVAEVVRDLMEALCHRIKDYCITNRLMVVTAEDDDLGVADGRYGRLAAR